MHISPPRNTYSIKYAELVQYLHVHEYKIQFLKKALGPTFKLMLMELELGGGRMNRILEEALQCVNFYLMNFFFVNKRFLSHPSTSLLFLFFCCLFSKKCLK